MLYNEELLEPEMLDLLILQSRPLEDVELRNGADFVAVRTQPQPHVYTCLAPLVVCVTIPSGWYSQRKKTMIHIHQFYFLSMLPWS